MPPPERVARSAATQVAWTATERRNRTSRSRVYRVTGRSRILRLTANGIQHCPVPPARRAVGPSTSARRGLRTQFSQTGSCAPLDKGQHERTDRSVGELASAQKNENPRLA